MSRYSRQILLPEIGIEGQRKISSAKVLCIGAGGLGCPALLYLAAAGVGTLGIVDGDTVDVSNLHRQILFKTEDQGKPKALIAKERLLDLNPDILIEAYPEMLSENNAQALFQHYDIILDGSDNFTAKYLINDIAVLVKKPFVHGAIQGLEGRVSTFAPDKGGCYRCLYPYAPAAHVQACGEAGVIGSVAGIVGTMQAMEVLKLIIGNDQMLPLFNKLWVIDTKTMDVNVLNFEQREGCPGCSG